MSKVCDGHSSWLENACEETLRDSLCWMREWVNPPLSVPSACRNVSSRSWHLTLNICAQLSFRHADFENWLWKNSFLQFSLKNGLLLHSCQIIVYWPGGLTWQAGVLCPVRCTDSNLHFPSAGKVSSSLANTVIWKWDHWTLKIVSTAPKTVSDADTALILERKKTKPNLSTEVYSFGKNNPIRRWSARERHLPTMFWKGIAVFSIIIPADTVLRGYWRSLEAFP